MSLHVVLHHYLQVNTFSSCSSPIINQADSTFPIMPSHSSSVSPTLGLSHRPHPPTSATFKNVDSSPKCHLLPRVVTQIQLTRQTPIKLLLERARSLHFPPGPMHKCEPTSKHPHHDHLARLCAFSARIAVIRISPSRSGLTFGDGDPLDLPPAHSVLDMARSLVNDKIESRDLF